MGKIRNWILNILNFELGKKRIFRILELNSKKTKNSKFWSWKTLEFLEFQTWIQKIVKNSKKSKNSKFGAWENLEIEF